MDREKEQFIMHVGVGSSVPPQHTISNHFKKVQLGRGWNEREILWEIFQAGRTRFVPGRSAPGDGCKRKSQWIYCQFMLYFYVNRTWAKSHHTGWLKETLLLGKWLRFSFRFFLAFSRWSSHPSEQYKVFVIYNLTPGSSSSVLRQGECELAKLQAWRTGRTFLL